MRRNVFSIIMILVLFLGLFGCGSGNDLLEEGRIRYSVSVTPNDNGEDTQNIDVVQNLCDNETEEFMDFSTKVTIVADNNTAALKVTGYSVSFYPVRGVYYTSFNPIEMEDFTPPPELPSPLNDIRHTFTQPKVMQNGSLTFESVVWPADVKRYYVNEFLRDTIGLDGILNAGGYTEADSASFEYDYRVKLYCTDSEDNDFTLDAFGTVVLADYNNC
jgi:hypothetical protein